MYIYIYIYIYISVALIYTHTCMNIHVRAYVLPRTGSSRGPRGPEGAGATCPGRPGRPARPASRAGGRQAAETLGCSVPRVALYGTLRRGASQGALNRDATQDHMPYTRAFYVPYIHIIYAYATYIHTYAATSVICIYTTYLSLSIYIYIYTYYAHYSIQWKSNRFSPNDTTSMTA